MNDLRRCAGYTTSGIQCRRLLTYDLLCKDHKSSRSNRVVYNNVRNLTDPSISTELPNTNTWGLLVPETPRETHELYIKLNAFITNYENGVWENEIPCALFNELYAVPSDVGYVKFGATLYVGEDIYVVNFTDGFPTLLEITNEHGDYVDIPEGYDFHHMVRETIVEIKDNSLYKTQKSLSKVLYSVKSIMEGKETDFKTTQEYTTDIREDLINLYGLYYSSEVVEAVHTIVENHPVNDMYTLLESTNAAFYN